MPNFAGSGTPCRTKARSRRRSGEDQLKDHQGSQGL